MSGILYGVGLGPGDPELMTLKAARLIGAAEVISYPALPEGDSFARSIADDFIADNAQEIRIEIPMSRERGPAQAAYDAGAAEIAAVLRDGRDVVYLCEGDPLFFGSFMYLLARLTGEFEVTVVPGVTSMTAGAARARRPLAARSEVLSVIPATLDVDKLGAKVDAADSLAFIKIGRHLGKVKAVLAERGLVEQAIYLERVSLPQEVCLPMSECPDEAPYFSMILMTKGADPWL